MALRLSGLFHTNVSDMQKGEGASSVRLENDAGRTEKNDVSSKELTSGQTIRGEVLAKNGQEIQIRIGKDMIINAKMEQDIQASKGQMVTFEVRSNLSGTISLRPLFQNMSQENNALKALVQAGIECDAKSMQMVSAMMKEGMSISRENLHDIYRALMDIPETQIDNAVQLHRLQIMPTAENLEQFAAYKSYEHQLLTAFSEIAEEIPEAVSQLFSEGRMQEGIKLMDNLLTVFAEGEKQPQFSVQTENVSEDMLQDVVLTEEKSEEAAPVKTGADVPNMTGTDVQSMAGTDAQGMARTDAADVTGTESVSKGMTDTKTAAFTMEEAAAQESAEALEAEGLGSTRISLKEAVSPGDRQQLALLAQNAGAEKETVAQIQNGQIGKEELYQLLRTLTENADTPEKQKAVKDLFVSKGFQTLLKEKIGNQWTLSTPEQMEKEEVSKLYERLNEQTKQLTRVLSQAVRSDSPLFKSVQNLRENVDFLNQINQMYTYVQLPLKMGSSRAHGDLYVYTNKKNLAKQDGNVSAFLHLDMEHLGMVDVYVAMQQGRITTNFYLEDEESLNLLEKNMDMLTNHLTEKGYQTECSVQLREQSHNAMDELLAADKNISFISEQSFDVRA